MAQKNNRGHRQALFIAVKHESQPHCPVREDRLSKLWHTFIMEYYTDMKSCLKKNFFTSIGKGFQHSVKCVCGGTQVIKKNNRYRTLHTT